jgi:glycosyltransferase involved in cell wall biosynthesis
MRILFLDQFNQPGGAQHCLLDLLPAVLARGWQAVAMLPGEGPLSKSIRALGIEVLPVSCGPYTSGHKTLRDFVRFVGDVCSAARQIAACRKERSIDIVYVNGPRLMPAAALAGGKTLFHCHSYLAPRYLEWITAIPLRMAKANVVASSLFVAGPLRKWIPAQQMTVVYNGVRSGATRVGGRRPLRIGVVGRIAREKGQDVFLRAARILSARNSGCQFVICGAPLFSDSSFEGQVRALAKDLPVEFMGWRDDVTEVLAGLNLLVVPSMPVDATPRVIPQAFAARVPVVAFDNAGFREQIEDGRTGFLVQDRTPEALADKIEAVLRGDALPAIAEAAFSEWQKRFSIEVYQRNILEILERMS